MAKVKITLEAEISDLRSFFPDDPKGITIENIGSFLHDHLVCATLDKHLSALCCAHGGEDTVDPVHKAILRHSKDEEDLAERLMSDITIKLEP